MSTPADPWRSESTSQLGDSIARWIADRLARGPRPLHEPPIPDELSGAFDTAITEQGIGADAAFKLFSDVLEPACLPTDHPRFMAFVPSAPAPAAALFDSLLGASAIFGGSWIEGSGSVHAENEVLRWLAELAGLPEATRGVFVSGGCAGNLNALMVARERWKKSNTDFATRPVLVCSAEAHSSIEATARILDVETLVVPTDDRGRLDRSHIDEWVADLDDDVRRSVFAVAATAGTTNVGVIDDLDAAADLAIACEAWFHVDGAYGAAALLDDRVRPSFAGIERADSVIVDPHKWLFAPFDVCALLYRDPDEARVVHTQHAGYLDPILDDASFNPSDLAYHLTRRSRGLPLWFSLAVYGVGAYRSAVTASLDLAVAAARLVDASPHLELIMEPELSVVIFRRVGWVDEDYQLWCDRALQQGLAFVLPSEWNGETVFRCCFTNPATSLDDVTAVLDAMAGDANGLS